MFDILARDGVMHLKIPSVSSENYDPKLSQAGFMDLVCALQTQLKTADSALLLASMPRAQRVAVEQLQATAQAYVNVVETQ